MTDLIRRVGAGELKAQLHDGGEIALLDAREEGVFNHRHLLMASCVGIAGRRSGAAPECPGRVVR